MHIYFALRSYPNWMSNINILNGSFLSKYITSLYFMITTMTTVGYGDIVCVHIFLLKTKTFSKVFNNIVKISYKMNQ